MAGPKLEQATVVHLCTWRGDNTSSMFPASIIVNAGFYRKDDKVCSTSQFVTNEAS